MRSIFALALIPCLLYRLPIFLVARLTRYPDWGENQWDSTALLSATEQTRWVVLGMTISRLRGINARREPVMMAGMPVNRFHSFERMFFKDDIPVLQGITFPLKKTSFESGKIRLDKGAKVLGAARCRVDARTVSYASE